MLITTPELLKQYETTKRLWQGIPGIEVTKKGRVFLTWYSGGITEELRNFALLVCSDDGVHFSEPIAVAAAADQRCYDPCLWIDPLERLWFIWSQAPDYGVYAAICKDPDADHPEFEAPFFIGRNVMMNKPTVLRTGEWAFPIAVWNLINPADGPTAAKAQEDLAAGSYLYVTTDHGATFRLVGSSSVPGRSCDEHMILETQTGNLRMYVRTEYGIGAADSYDGGAHWSEGYDTGLGGPCSRFHIRRLRSGRVLLINHHRFTGRNNLTAMLSEDDGKTFPYKLLLDERSSVSYPDAAQSEDGRIYITYDRERGSCPSPYVFSQEKLHGCAREILTACITERDILAGKIVDDASWLKRVANKLTEYDGDLKNPYFEVKRFSNEEYAAYLRERQGADALTEIFNTYGVYCANMHLLDSQQLDQCIGQYEKSRDLDCLTKIISLVRRVPLLEQTSEDDLVKEICGYIVEHLESSETTEEIARNFHISTHYAYHLFKKRTGTTMLGFRTAQRLLKAKLLLRHSEESITRIAEACGYESHSYFTKTFTREVGMSPVQYRKLHA